MISRLNAVSTPEELLQAYTTMLTLFGGAFVTSPVEAGLTAFCDKGLLRNLPVESENPTFRNASRLLMSPCPSKSNCSSASTSNYYSLFVSGSSAFTKPVASNWHKKVHGSETRKMNVTMYYTRYGFERSPDCELEDDHLGIELLFINNLLEKFLTEDDAEIKELIRKDLLSFISHEVLSWVPGWADAIAARSTTKCYTGIAGLVLGSLQDIYDILKEK